VALATVVVWMPNAVAAMIAAMLVFSTAYSNPALAGKMLGGLVGAILLLAPAIPLVARLALPAAMDAESALAVFPIWADIVRGEGPRLLTGHGFDTAARALAIGHLPAGAPRGILFEIWYELGLLGAAGLAALAWCAFSAAGRADRAIAPFLLAALACAFVVAIAGLSIAQLWWVTLLALAAVCFAIVMRGHQRDTRIEARAAVRRPSI
jgi:hypothetical protein